MELRSSRSRSTTPFTRVESFETEVHIGRANHVEKSYSKTTSSKRSTVIRSGDDVIGSMEEHTGPTTRRSARLEKGLRSMYKTSDYSSEEGENEVTSTRSISQNEKNQLIEDARAAANGNSEVSALELYRKSGRYWDVYPKTDWTYSHYSKDRVELAPGVVAMPNMSRRTIHSLHHESKDFVDRETNTDYSTRQVKRALFVKSHSTNERSKSRYYLTRTWQLVLTSFLTVLTVITRAFRSSFEVQSWLYEKLHSFASEVMVVDSWLMVKRQGGNKQARLLALCFVPLVLLGGLWALMSLGSFVCRSYVKEETVETDRVGATVGLGDEQLEAISRHLKDRYAEDVVGDISKLRDEIDKLRLDVSTARRSRRSDLLSLNARNDVRLSRCCGRSMSDVEDSVRRILTGLLNDVEFLRDQDGFNEYIRNVFLANQELERRLSVLTANLSDRFDGLIADNNKVVMDKVADVVRAEMRNKVDVVKEKETYVGGVGLSEGEVLKIVKKVLTIYDADKTGLVDYALETAGGQIITTRCTENYRFGTAVTSIFGVPLWYSVNSPRTIISSDIQPGECWAFQNFPGFVVIQLYGAVEIEAFSLEHISRLLVPNGKIDSAPKEFEVYGLETENDKHPVLLGSYVYDYDGEPLQMFPVQTPGKVFRLVELRVASNHGNPKFTCLYRFRVHGRLHTEPGR